MKTITTRLLFVLAVTFTLPVSSSMGQKSELNGTSWQLIKLNMPDESTIVPNDPSKYTITFGRDGRVIARVDCNRASSTWRSARAGELQFGSWSRGSAKCASDSLHDKIVNEGGAVRTYVIKDGHLFLSGMKAGGSYELAPMTPKRKPTQ
jgi:para-nitrobenzyl esterase